MPNLNNNIAGCFLDYAQHFQANSPDSIDIKTLKNCNCSLENEKIRTVKLENDAYQLLIKMRKTFAIIVAIIVSAWLLFVAYLILSVSHQWYFVELSDNVLLSLIRCSTVNIIGLLTIILTFCFGKQKSLLI